MTWEKTGGPRIDVIAALCTSRGATIEAIAGNCHLPRLYGIGATAAVQEGVNLWGFMQLNLNN